MLDDIEDLGESEDYSDELAAGAIEKAQHLLSPVADGRTYSNSASSRLGAQTSSQR